MPSALEPVFEFLFKYRLFVFEKGRFALNAPWPIYVAVLLALAVAVPSVLGYGRVGAKAHRDDRLFLAGLRVAALAVVLFCLGRPVLVLSTVVPQQTFVGVLVDDSRSMQIADVNGQPRSAFVGRELGPEGALLKAMEARFKLRFFRFSKTAERMAGLSELSFKGKETDLAGALERARAELGTVPLSGLVLITDGSHNVDTPFSEPLLALRAKGVPVFAVGLGRERFAKDVELNRVEAPRSVLKGSAVAVDLTLSQRGGGGRRVPLQIEDGGRIVSTQEVTLPAEGESASVRVYLTAAEAGPRSFRLRVQPDPEEGVKENNEQEVLIAVKDGREKILYFEGEPRFELKFVRRAVDGDPNLQLVSLQRTAEDKFLRLDVDDAEELATGFPKTREELFRYRGLVLGSVEASFFTAEQLRMMGEFVSQRGGGLLMLGGRRSFAEGGYAPTPLADVLPVVLEPRPAREGQHFFAELKVERTPFGAAHSALQLTGSPEETGKRWRGLPPLSTFNPVRRIKPGAAALLIGKGGNLPETQVVLAHQRFGRGKALAFTVQDSWQWQMHADVPLEDTTHESLWRQLLRWLVSDVPDPVNVTTQRDRVEPGEAVTLSAEVQDETFMKVNNATVTARVKPPSGEAMVLSLEWTVERDGEYRGRFVPQEEGLHQITVEARRGDERLGTGLSHVEVGDLRREYFGAEMRSSLLKRIAEETGGRFYTADTARALPEDLSYVEGGSTVIEEKDLWDMPAVFLLLLTLLGAEWGYRRARGLA